MPSEQQNKIENVVELRRAEFVASIEKKLSEARRLFSLRDYASCADLVQEVLGADPQNSKAKALLDLSSIKLSKRKLYKKIAEDPPSHSTAAGPDLEDTQATPYVAGGPRDSRPASETLAPQPALPSSTLPSAITSEPQAAGGRSLLSGSKMALPQDSVREKTISALVDLLKNKDAQLDDWRSNRQARISPTNPSSLLQSDAATPPVTVEKPTALSGVVPPRTTDQPPALAPLKDAQLDDWTSNRQARISPTAPSPLVQSEAVTPMVTVEKPTALTGVIPPRATDQPPGLAPLEANSDFVPGSLDDLFDVASQQSAQPHHPRTQPPVTLANTKPQKDLHFPTARSFPGEPSEPKQRPPVDLRTQPKQPEVNRQPPSAVEPPKKEDRKVSESLQAVPPPPPSVPVIPPAPPARQLKPPPDIHIFDQITTPRPIGHQQEVGHRVEGPTEAKKDSELQAGAIAQIKKHLYQEEYDLCARELERIRDLFPKSPEIQTFVENTSKRLVDLQRLKKFELRARDLMASAVAFYQEGKREEALIAVREILRVNPNHVQAREFVGFVERHQGKGPKKQPAIQKVRTCRSCGSEIDGVSQFCYYCGKQL